MSEVRETLEIVNSRRLNHPRERVFEAFRDPERLKTWWGPKGFSNTIHAYDFRPGGEWRFTMHAPGGASFDNLCVFLEIAAPEVIVFRHEEPVHVFVMHVTLMTDTSQGCEIDWRMVFEDGPGNAPLKAFLEQANEENFDRLEACLERMASGET